VTDRAGTWLGPYLVQGETYFVRRHGPDSSPHWLPRAASRLWELLEADFDDPTRPRAGGRASCCVLDNDAPDEEGLRRLLGPGFQVTYLPGWGAHGSGPAPQP
jgi:hypothetical protein